jgi:hypothetical protein
MSETPDDLIHAVRGGRLDRCVVFVNQQRAVPSSALIVGHQAH